MRQLMKRKHEKIDNENDKKLLEHYEFTYYII